MPDYKKLYFHLFNRLTDLQEEITRIQQEMEELFISSEENQTEEILPLKQFFENPAFKE